MFSKGPAQAAVLRHDPIDELAVARGGPKDRLVGERRDHRRRAWNETRLQLARADAYGTSRRSVLNAELTTPSGVALK
jgi:hypothetical protein